MCNASRAAEDSARGSIGLIHQPPQTDPKVGLVLLKKVRELDTNNDGGTDNESGGGESFTAARFI